MCFVALKRHAKHRQPHGDFPLMNAESVWDMEVRPECAIWNNKGLDSTWGGADRGGTKKAELKEKR